jgi:hypothetical protein
MCSNHSVVHCSARFSQDPVWADQAYVFPDWHSYSNQLADRAELAGRHWLDSIAPDSRRGSSSSSSNVQQTSSGKKWSGEDAAASVAQRVQQLSRARGAAAAAEL